MTRKLTCIECPKGCVLSVEVEKDKVVKVSGNLCPKGLVYAASEIENPARILTSAVLGKGLDLKMIPVRTDRPIPKSRLMEAMREIKNLKIEKEVHLGDVIAENFLGLGVNLISTRETK